MRIKLLFALLLAALYTHGQEGTSKRLRGKINGGGKDVVGVVVQNATSGHAVITDVYGNFTILVQLNDTLVFSAVQFKRKVLPISKILFNTSFVTVPLEEFVNELEEVVVRPYDLTGDLNQDVVGLKLEKNVSAEALGLPNAHTKIISQSERKLQEASGMRFKGGGRLGGAGGVLTLNPIINAITGRTKMLKNRVRVDKTYARTQRVHDFYADSLFVVTLKIPVDKIDDFMYFCEVDTTFQKMVDTKDKLKIWDFMISKSRAYIKNNQPD